MLLPTILRCRKKVVEGHYRVNFDLAEKVSKEIETQTQSSRKAISESAAIAKEKTCGV